MAQSHALQAPDATRTLLAMGAQITFASGRDAWVERLPPGTAFHELPFTRHLSASSLPRAASELRRLLARDWDLVQLQTPVGAGLARLVMPRRRAYRALYVAHGLHVHAEGEWLPNLLGGAVETALAGRVDALAVVVGEDHTWAQRRGLDRRTRLYRLPGAGVDTCAFREATPDPALPVPYALYCGELVPNKDPLRAVEAIRAYNERYGRLGLAMVGTGALQAQVLRAAAPLAQAGLFRHVERSFEVARLMRGAECLLLPSRREGLPRVVIEALACGLPCLCRANRGTRELLQGLGPMLVDGERSATDWAAALDLVLGAQRPAPAALAARAEQYSSAAFSTAYAAMVTEVLGR